MNLLVDLGNSRVKWAYADTQRWEIGAETIPDEGFSSFLDRLWANHPVPDQVVVSSVHGPHRRRLLHDWVARQWGCDPHFIQAQARELGVTNCYRDPSALGADRWVALIAARHQSQAAQCVVDCGTAVTVDALSETGEFLGGVILPGINMARAALLANTQEIRVSEGEENGCLARATGDGVAAGTVFGLAGAIERIVAEQRRALGAQTRVLLTGGDAPRLLTLLRGVVAHEPDLVLKGIKLVAEARS